MGTRMEKETSLLPTTRRFPDTKTMKMFLRLSGSLTTAPVDSTGTMKVRATFRATNIPRSLSPLVNNLFGSRGSAAAYFDRYTLEIINPVMKMKDGVKNRKY